MPLDKAAQGLRRRLLFNLRRGLLARLLPSVQGHPALPGGGTAGGRRIGRAHALRVALAQEVDDIERGGCSGGGEPHVVRVVVALNWCA
jgi:hypothetical protein